MSVELSSAFLPAPLLASLDGMRAGLFYMLLALAGSFGSALLGVRRTTEEEPGTGPLWRAILLAALLWLAVLGAARTLAALLDTWPGLGALPPLLGPAMVALLLAGWRLGDTARLARAFACSPRQARRLALDPAPARRRLLALSLGAAIAAGMFAARLPADELGLGVLLALGLVRCLAGRSPEAAAAVAFLLVAPASATAALTGLAEPATVAVASAILATVWTALRGGRPPRLA